ncbi:MAG: WbqC family protein [Rikenellaceae bacterium]
MTTILPTAFFPSIEYMQILGGGDVLIEAHENYIKQSERNRCLLLSDKGVERLTVPVARTGGAKVLISDVRIDYAMPWQRTHLRTIRTLYANAPYFDHYFPVVEELLSGRESFLLDLNNKILERWIGIFGISDSPSMTSEYCGLTARPRVEPCCYVQVWAEKIPFQGGLSSLDYLFCEGASL